jgi:hypothetical protein
MASLNGLLVNANMAIVAMFKQAAVGSSSNAVFGTELAGLTLIGMLGRAKGG